MTDGQKEEIKLRATFANGIGLASVAVGGLAPSIALMSKHFDETSIINGAVIFIAGILAASLFHRFIYGESPF